MVPGVSSQWGETKWFHVLSKIAMELLCMKTTLAQTLQSQSLEGARRKTYIMQRAKLCSLKVEGNLTSLSGESCCSKVPGMQGSTFILKVPAGPDEQEKKAWDCVSTRSSHGL